MLIKFGLRDIPALTFAGLRYTLAFLVLLPFVLVRPGQRREIASLSRTDWRRLLSLGIVFYTITQGAMFVGLAFVPAMTLSLVLSFSPAAVALLAIPLLGEKPTRIQWVGIVMFLIGAMVYFAPFDAAVSTIGWIAALTGLIANAIGSVMGREVNRGQDIHPLIVTTVSMGIGSLSLLAVGLAVEGWPRIDGLGWANIAWLAVVNTAFAFTLWNHTLRRLSAMESSLINNTMLIQIALLAWLFLGEPLGWKEIVGIVVAALGVLLVQLRGVDSEDRARS